MDINNALLVPVVLYLALSHGAFAQSTGERPNSVDHAGILQSLDKQDFEAGKSIYMNLCANCHVQMGLRRRCLPPALSEKGNSSSGRTRIPCFSPSLMETDSWGRKPG